jgi:signal transduction histidine kinase
MERSGGFRLSSLRAQLGVTALGGLITTAAMTGLLLLTAWSASDIVQTARRTHDRVRVYTQLQTAAGNFQRVSYQNAREDGESSRRAVAVARTRFENLLAEASRLPDMETRDAQVRRLIVRQGAVALKHFEHPIRHVEGVDRQWREGGSRAALREVSRISRPIFVLDQTLQAEIRRGDWKVAEGTRSAQSLIGTSVVAALIGLLLALGFSIMVQMLLQLRLRPSLRRLEMGAQAFGAGHLGHRIGLTGTDELAHLSDAFDTMAATIAEKQDALREIQLGLEQAVADRTRELRQANAELSAVDERRRAFLADVGHELRTPLTVIRGETQVALRLAERPGFDPHEVFERILHQTQDLSRMVNDLFLIARAQAGGLPLELELLDLQEIAARVTADFETLASEMGGSIRVLPHPPVFAFVDRDRLRRALAALIENALRHCQQGVNITLELALEQSTVSIAVCDDGPGVEFAHAEQLFQRFRRGQSRGEGSGLGLSLVSALVQAHGGYAALKPRAGRGTRAVLHLPLPEQNREAA